MKTYLESHLPRYLSHLRRLVECNSFTANVPGVESQAELTAHLFVPLGFEVERVPARSSNFARHLFLHHPGHSNRYIALISHLDTVFPPEEELHLGFTWREEGDRLIGPGVADIKGGTIVALMALDALRARHRHVFESINWLVGLDAAEERLEPDFAQHVRLRSPAPNTLACLVFECGADRQRDVWPVVAARKGMCNFQIRVTGKAAHAGTGFWRGRNAILAASRLALALSELSDRQRELTVNLGTVQGGTVTNRVPHECLLAGEVRAFDPQVLAEGLERIRERVEGEEGATIEFVSPLSPWPSNPGTLHLLELFQMLGTRLGMKIEAEHRAGLSDGNLLWEHAPTLDGLGPTGGHVHCSQPGTDGLGQEYVWRSSFVPKALLVAESLRVLIEGKG